MVSDNGPQYSSEAYAEHVSSSLCYPQSNGEAEQAVQTEKNLLKKEGDPYLALLLHRSTPLKIQSFRVADEAEDECTTVRKLETLFPGQNV